MKFYIDPVSLFFIFAAAFAAPAFVIDQPEPTPVVCVEDGYGSDCTVDLKV